MSSNDVAPTRKPLTGLALKVYNTITREDCAVTAAAQDTVGMPTDRRMTKLELDVIDWGTTFGIAYGIARADDPFAPDRDVIAAALDAARVAYTDWGGDYLFTGVAYLEDRASRDNEFVIAVAETYDSAVKLSDSLPPTMTLDLDDAIRTLTGAYGA